MGITFCLRPRDSVRIGDNDLVVDSVYLAGNRKYAVLRDGQNRIALDSYQATYHLRDVAIKISPHQPETSQERIRLFFEAPPHMLLRKVKR